MSRALSVASVLEKSKLVSNVPFLVLLDIEVIDPESGESVEHIYLANDSEEFIYQGHVYQPFVFDIGLKQESGAQPTITLTFNDLSNTIQAKMQQYRGGVGFQVAVMVVNTGNKDQPPEVVEQFEVVGASSANYQVTFQLGAESALAKPFPRRRQMRDFCAWRFKDGNCKYAGEATTCDRTLNGANGCAVKVNTINFGGYPGITAGARYG